jgi:hypothetical protein
MDRSVLQRHPITPERLSELTQLFMSCWEEMVTRQPALVLPENEASLRRTIAAQTFRAGNAVSRTWKSCDRVRSRNISLC